MANPNEIEKKVAADFKKLKDSLDKERYEKELAIAKENWAKQDQQMREQGTTIDERTGKPVAYWDQVKSKGKEFTKPTGRDNTVEWSTAQMEIFAAIYDLNRAIYYTPMTPNILRETFHKIDPIRKLTDKVKQALGKDPLVKKAVLAHSVTVDDKGVPTIKAYKDKVPFTAEQQQWFDTGVVAWAAQHGYEMDRKGALLKDGNPLTPKKLDELMRDPDQGLNAFLTGNFDLKFSPQTTPRI